MNVRIELKVLSSKIMTVIQNLDLVLMLMAGNQHQQVTSDLGTLESLVPSLYS